MGIRIDIGCGSYKKEGCLGVDYVALPGVDYVVDLSAQPLPFPDRSVEFVYSHHFFEHLEDPSKVFAEIGRVAADGAQLEFWTPYTFSGSAFVFGHKFYLNEEHYLHLCVLYPDFWKEVLHSRWLLKEIRYIVKPETLLDLEQHGVSLDFAIRYYKDVVSEWGVFIEVRLDYDGPVIQPQHTWALDIYAQPQPLVPDKVVSSRSLQPGATASSGGLRFLWQASLSLLRRVYRRLFPR